MAEFSTPCRPSRGGGLSLSPVRGQLDDSLQLCPQSVQKTQHAAFVRVPPANSAVVAVLSLVTPEWLTFGETLRVLVVCSGLGVELLQAGLGEMWREQPSY